MKLSSLRRLGFTLIELLVVISIIAILASLALPAITGALVRGQMTQSLSNMKQLHLSTQQMALDATTTGDREIGWPGDLEDSTWANWAGKIVEDGHMTAPDFIKMISAPGVTPRSTATPEDPGVSAVVVYRVRESDPGNTIFLTSGNYRVGNTTLETVPFQGRGFIVFRKGGDGAIYLPRQAGASEEELARLIGVEPAGGVIGGQPGVEL
jgi:prepilin-type N-terminal cleavage/methylation domain-containing protein